MFKKLYEKFKDLCRKLVSLKDTPHAIAGGAAIGIFIGFTPLFGLKTLLSLAVAYILRCNPIAAVIAVSLHDVVWLLGPVFLRWEYDIGYWLLSHPHVLPPKLALHHVHLSDVMKWKTLFNPDFFVKIGWPVFLGSLVLSTPLAVATYFGMLGLLKYREKIKAHKLP